MWESGSNVHWDKHVVQNKLFELCLLLEDEELDIFQFSVMDQEDISEDPEGVDGIETRMWVAQEVDDIVRAAEQELSDMDFPISELLPIYDQYTPSDVMRAALGESSIPDCSPEGEQLEAVHKLYWTMKHFIRKLQQVSLGSRPPALVAANGDAGGATVGLPWDSSGQVSLTELDRSQRAPHVHLALHEPSALDTPGQCSYAGTKCRPCRWHHTSTGCRLGLQCKFCHVCPREKRPNQKMRAARRYWAGVREREAQIEAAMAGHFGSTYHDSKGLNADATPFWPSEVMQASLNDQQ